MSPLLDRVAVGCDGVGAAVGCGPGEGAGVGLGEVPALCLFCLVVLPAEASQVGITTQVVPGGSEKDPTCTRTTTAGSLTRAR